MASTINNLYLKYCNRVQWYLENDAYYQYLLELIASGKTTVTQMNRVLDKSVDEKWLTAIEETIPTIHEIIAHPKKFIKTVEEIMPVERVKKVGPDTVQHLASHTQYITGMRGGDIYPGKLLSVTNEESIDLYENRFVNTLIQKLAEFIEKRTGALFWDTGDEETSILRMESTVEDDYELIEYRLDMTVKSKQTYLENDAGKMEIFKRIDRVRRIVADFRQSAFVQLMSQTAPVRSPVQRTNQIMKNPDYRKCYELWQFLERYDEVGYSIDVRETALEFDEDYLFQMYGNLALNYTVFKSLLEKDTRRITENPKRRKTVKPKFVKQIVEEFVDDYDIPDVEIRKVIIEEVTKAQMEIERRTAEAQAAREKAQAEREKAKGQARLAREKEKEKERLAKEKEREKEKARLAKEKEKEKARIAKEKEREKEKARLAKEKEKERARIAKEKEREKEKARLAKEKEKEKARIAKEKEREKEKARLVKEKEKEKERLAKEKEKTKASTNAAKTAGAPQGGTSKAKPTASEPKPAGAKPKTAAAKPKTAPKPKAEEEAVPLETNQPAAVPALAVARSSKPVVVTEQPAVPEAAPNDAAESERAGRDVQADPEPVQSLQAPPPIPAPTEEAVREQGTESALTAADSGARTPVSPAELPEPAAKTASGPEGDTARKSAGNPLLDWIARRRRRGGPREK